MEVLKEVDVKRSQIENLCLKQRMTAKVDDDLWERTVILRNDNSRDRSSSDQRNIKIVRFADNEVLLVDHLTRCSKGAAEKL